MAGAKKKTVAKPAAKKPVARKTAVKSGKSKTIKLGAKVPGLAPAAAERVRKKILAAIQEELSEVEGQGYDDDTARYLMVPVGVYNKASSNG